MMSLAPRDFMPLPRYRRLRPQMRHALNAHRHSMAHDLGPCVRVQFEDLLTVWFRVQEAACLAGVDDGCALWELIEAHAHLLPEPGQIKATVSVTPSGFGDLPGTGVPPIALRLAPGLGWTVPEIDGTPHEGGVPMDTVQALRFKVDATSGGSTATIACLDPGYRHQVRVRLPAVPDGTVALDRAGFARAPA